MNCNPFLIDTALTPYISAIRCRVPKNYGEEVSISAIVSEKGCTVNFIGNSYTAEVTESGMYTVDTPELYLTITTPSAGTIIEQPPVIVNPARVEYTDIEELLPIETAICVKTPIRCSLIADKLVIDISENVPDIGNDAEPQGIQTINGLIPDDFGNIVIRSVSPKILVTIDKG